MNDLISRKNMLSDIEENILKGKSEHEDLAIMMLEMFKKYIEEFPAADVPPVKHGDWVYHKKTEIFEIYECSVCATPFSMPVDVVPSSVFCYCPHCGTRMDGDKE